MSTPIRPTVVAGRGFAVVGAMLLGVSALMTFLWTSQDWLRVLIVLALFAIGVAINGNRTDDDDDPITRALGTPVKTGIGAAATFLGAYLVGPLILAFLVDGDQPPSTSVVLLLVFGLPLLALLRFVTRGMPVGVIGTAVVVPLLIAALMATAGASASTVAIVNVVLALAALVAALVLPGDSRWAEFLVVFGGMAASFAVGAGTSAVGSLTASTQTGGQRSAGSTAGALPPAPQAVVLALGLLAAVGLVLVALARRQFAGGLVAGSVLAAPPASLLVEPFFFPHTAADVVLLAVPALVAVLAVVASIMPASRRVLPARLLGSARLEPARPIGRPVLAAAVGVAFVVAAQSVWLLDPAFGWARPTAVLAAVFLVGAAVLAWYLPGGPGVVLAAAVLVGLQLGQPWWRVAYAWSYGGTTSGVRVMAAVGLVVTVAVAAVLVVRHRRPAVFAAAAYAVAGAVATMLAAVWQHSYEAFLGSPFGLDVMIIAWLVGPLLLLGIPAAVAALRGRGGTIVIGQAVGVVLLAAGGFALALMLLPPMREQGGYAGLSALLPTVPWNIPIGPTVPSTSRYWLAALAMFVIAVPLLLSTIRRRSVPLAVAGVFVVAESATVCFAGIADRWDDSSVTKLIVVLLIVAGLVAVTAVELLRHRGSLELAEV